MTAETTPENVDRFVPDCFVDDDGFPHGLMVERSHGEYVRYSDFAALAEKCRRLEKEVEGARQVLAEALDANVATDGLLILAVRSANALYWRNQRAEQAEAERDAAVKNEQRYFWVERNAKVETQEWVYEPDEGYRPLSERVDAAMANSGEPK